mmetsp:Transcript_38103/g.113847  ORF Transcript_38103/g.113847 Transcript_38103/m.113847 type:complete len:120 (+) Transcript_38103:217-576(+)
MVRFAALPCSPAAGRVTLLHASLWRSCLSHISLVHCQTVAHAPLNQGLYKSFSSPSFVVSQELLGSAAPPDLLFPNLTSHSHGSCGTLAFISSSPSHPSNHATPCFRVPSNTFRPCMHL